MNNFPSFIQRINQERRRRTQIRTFGRMAFVFFLLLLLTLTAVTQADRIVPSPTETPIPDHWQLQEGESAYILCAGSGTIGHFEIVVNGPDSIQVKCQP